MGTYLVKNISNGAVDTPLRALPLQPWESLPISGPVPEKVKWLVGEKILSLVPVATPEEKPKAVVISDFQPTPQKQDTNLFKSAPKKA